MGEAPVDDGLLAAVNGSFDVRVAGFDEEGGRSLPQWALGAPGERSRLVAIAGVAKERELGSLPWSQLLAHATVCFLGRFRAFEGNPGAPSAPVPRSVIIALVGQVGPVALKLCVSTTSIPTAKYASMPSGRVSLRNSLHASSPGNPPGPARARAAWCPWRRQHLRPLVHSVQELLAIGRTRERVHIMRKTSHLTKFCVGPLGCTVKGQALLPIETFYSRFLVSPWF